MLKSSAGQSITSITRYGEYVYLVCDNEESQLCPDLIILNTFGELISMAVVSTIISGQRRIAMQNYSSLEGIHSWTHFPLRKDRLL